MSAIEMLLQELDHEAKATRRVLERVPEDRLGWKPHDRSMSLGQLGLHVAIVPGAIAEMSQNRRFRFPSSISRARPASRSWSRRSTRAWPRPGQILSGMTMPPWPTRGGWWTATAK